MRCSVRDGVVQKKAASGEHILLSAKREYLVRHVFNVFCSQRIGKSALNFNSNLRNKYTHDVHSAKEVAFRF